MMIILQKKEIQIDHEKRQISKLLMKITLGYGKTTYLNEIFLFDFK